MRMRLALAEQNSMLDMLHSQYLRLCLIWFLLHSEIFNGFQSLLG